MEEILSGYRIYLTMIYIPSRTMRNIISHKIYVKQENISNSLSKL